MPMIPSMRSSTWLGHRADASIEVNGIRPGEKLHEEMISVDDARRTRAADRF